MHVSAGNAGARDGAVRAAREHAGQDDGRGGPGCSAKSSSALGARQKHKHLFIVSIDQVSFKHLFDV